MPPPPKWYMPVAIAALVWNLLGCFAYLMDVTVSPEAVATMSEAQQALYASRTMWMVSATAIAVWGGAVGSLGLILRKRWALPVLLVSLAGLIVQDIGLFAVANAASLAGARALVLQGLVLVIAVALVYLARQGIGRGWIGATA